MKKETKFGIVDNGIGISEENQEKVLDVFKRVAHQNNYDSTGMGLAVCKKIIEHHGGEIWIDSVLGKGSTFLFTIPKDLPLTISANPEETKAPNLTTANKA